METQKRPYYLQRRVEKMGANLSSRNILFFLLSNKSKSEVKVHIFKLRNPSYQKKSLSCMCLRAFEFSPTVHDSCLNQSVSLRDICKFPQQPSTGKPPLLLSLEMGEGEGPWGQGVWVPGRSLVTVKTRQLWQRESKD